MTTEHLSALPKAKIEKSRVSWLLWLVPLAALGVCASFVVRDYVLAGPEITVYFQNVDGLEAGNSPVQYRGATVGEVKSLELSKDLKLVGVKTRLKGPAAALARQGTLFWIVRPEVSIGSISGLRTIVSGNYVTMLPGDGPPTNSFLGLEKQPLGEKGALEITLTATKVGSLQEGSPVYYRGVEVGQVLDFRLGDDARAIVIRASIHRSYAPLVRVDSKFWNAGGLNLHVGLFSGAKMSAISPQSVVGGAIEFATPPNYEGVATNGAVFALHEKADEIWEKWSPLILLNSPPPPAMSLPPPDRAPSLLDVRSK